jgi:hypothetical protein
VGAGWAQKIAAKKIGSIKAPPGPKKNLFYPWAKSIPKGFWSKMTNLGALARRRREFHGYLIFVDFKQLRLRENSFSLTNSKVS